ncbi:MAG: nickel pincer cofactor biosynthesis protein LarC [Desulfatiglandaceae bacterium]
MKIAYLDCFSGVSGDMFLGALLDAGLPVENLRNALGTLPLRGYEIESETVLRSGIAGCSFKVHVENKEHQHRNVGMIREMINSSGLSEWVKARSVEMFERLARVEGAAHGRDPEKVHFHEVGAVDSIIDIVGGVYGVEALGINELHVSALPLGSGFVESAHGFIPLPAPATAALLEGVPVYDSEQRREMVTPTGALLVTTMAASFGGMPSMTVRRIGYGAGSSDPKGRPNLLRIILGEPEKPESGADTETVAIIKTNVDDMTPENVGFLMERLFDAGALDVVFCPVHMKKNRPGVRIEIIGRPGDKDALINVVLRESTSLGVRFRYSARMVLERRQVTVESPWGAMPVKEVIGPEGRKAYMPEFEECRKVALERNIALKEIFAWVSALGEPWRR